LIVLDEGHIAKLLDPAGLIGAVRRAFEGALESPERTHHQLPGVGGELPGVGGATLLMMPAWRSTASIGVKVITVDLGRQDSPTVEGVYLLLDGRTGALAALLAARALTSARTAAVSALAASYLAPAEASTLLMIGTGNLARYLVAAHCCVRPIERVLVWGRSAGKAARLAEQLRSEHAELEIAVVEDLRHAVAQADVISCATSSAAAVLYGDDLSPATHVDLVGSFKATMREADDAVFARGRLVVDTAAALSESGDLIEPVRAGLVDPAQVADLAALVRDAAFHRRSRDEITIFKAVGTAIADLATAEFLLERHSRTEAATSHE
jgi:alanine dehydrogenase